MAADTTAAESAPAGRKEVSNEKYVGRVLNWKNHYGWLEPSTEINHPEVTRHNGRIYVSAQDLTSGLKRLRPGSWVEFGLYSDEQGLGASNVAQRRVMRFTIPRAESEAVLGANGSGIPQLETEQGVTIRSFEWMQQDGTVGTLNFLLLEIWGEPQSISNATVAIGTRLANAEKFELNALVPESRVWKIDLRTLRQMIPSATLSKEFALTDPMPCRKLTLAGSVEEVGEAVKAIIGQVCDY
jgi:cold shock CspA family protein